MKKSLYLLGAVCGLALLGCAPPQKESVKIGAIFSVTGPASFLGAPEEKTARMLAEQINTKGGVNGQKIELIIKDSGGSPEKAVSFAKQLIEEDKVLAIIGPSTWITNAENGFLIPIENENILAMRIVEAIRNKELLKKASEKNRMIIKDKAYWKENIIKMVNIYKGYSMAV